MTSNEKAPVTTNDEGRTDPTQTFSLAAPVPVKRTDWHVSPLMVGDKWSVMWGNVQVALVGYRDYAEMICKAMNGYAKLHEAVTHGLPESWKDIGVPFDRLRAAAPDMFLAINAYFDQYHDGDALNSWETELWYAAEKAKGEWSPW